LQRKKERERKEPKERERKKEIIQIILNSSLLYQLFLFCQELSALS
jgi:hypothetical protein